MTLSNAARQARWRDKRKAADRTNVDAIERALLLELERCDQMSDQERTALADRLADLAMDFQRRAIRISKRAHKLRTGSDHQGAQKLGVQR